MHLDTPILFLIFNRPEKTQLVFDEIKRAKPKKLYVAADGPRDHISNERELCSKTRDIVSQIDWHCEVKTLFRDTNLGCKLAVSSAISWFFSDVEEGIILEDDCLPHPSFFNFCSTILDKYRHDTRVMMVTGVNFQPYSNTSPTYSYYFSRYANIWGWATWRRAWQHYDANLKMWPEIKDGNWHYAFAENKEMAAHWEHILQEVYEGKIDTWDYQWNFACKIQNGLSVVPHKNLVSNIGFDTDATHTSKAANSIFIKPLESMQFPLQHPEFVLPDLEADKILVKSHFAFLKHYKIKQYIKNFIPTFILKKLVN